MTAYNCEDVLSIIREEKKPKLNDLFKQVIDELEQTQPLTFDQLVELFGKHASKYGVRSEQIRKKYLPLTPVFMSWHLQNDELGWMEPVLVLLQHLRRKEEGTETPTDDFLKVLEGYFMLKLT